jgi:hypothetical protein
MAKMQRKVSGHIATALQHGAAAPWASDVTKEKRGKDDDGYIIPVVTVGPSWQGHGTVAVGGMEAVRLASRARAERSWWDGWFTAAHIRRLRFPI